MQLTGFASLIISSLGKRGRERKRERERAFDTEDRSRFSRLVSHGFINRIPYPLEKRRGGRERILVCRAYIYIITRVYICRREGRMRMRSLERNAREYMSISCTFASNNACRHLARSYGYRGVKDAHVERRTRIYIYICLLAFSVYTLRMYISAINTPNRFVNLGRWKVGMERGGVKKVRGSLFKSPRTSARTGEWH